MKQHIAIAQLFDLTEEQLQRFKLAFYPPYYALQVLDKKVLQDKPDKILLYNEGNTYVYFPKLGHFYALPNIGQMIEFLGEKGIDWTFEIDRTDPCDFLWNKVVDTL